MKRKKLERDSPQGLGAGQELSEAAADGIAEAELERNFVPEQPERDDDEVRGDGDDHRRPSPGY